MTNSNQKSSFVNKVKFALIGTLVLGGGSLALMFSQNLMNKNQTQSNPQFKIDNTSQGGQGGQGGNIGYVISNQQSGSSSMTTSPKLNDGLNSSNTNPKIDVASPNIKWSLKYPVYKIQNDKCVLAGAAAVTLDQSSGGGLGYYGQLNVYDYSKIQGTITASGKVNISLSSDNGNYLLTLDGENPQISTNETVIAGKATMLNCPDSTFELRK